MIAWLGGSLLGAIGALLAVYYHSRARFLAHLVGDSRSTLNAEIARAASEKAALRSDVARRDALIRTLTKDLNHARAQLDAISTPEVLRNRLDALGLHRPPDKGVAAGVVPGPVPAATDDPIPDGTGGSAA